MLIACGDQAELTVVDLGEREERRLGRVLSGNAQWSPDGRRIAFHAGPFPDLKVVNSDGSDPHRLLIGQVGDFAWSPNGHEIAAVDQTQPEAESPEDFRTISYLYVVNVAGKRRRLGRFFNPSWSPDGRMIVVSTDRSIEVMSAEGRRQRTLGEGFGPSWSPDGSQIAFVGDRGHSVYVVRGDDTKGRPIPIPAGWFAEEIVWSPDGERLAYLESFLVSGGGDPDPLDDEYAHRLVVTDINGRSPIRIDIDVRPAGGSGGGYSAWSPDGKQIAFLGRGGGLFVRTIRGGVEKFSVCGKDAFWGVFGWRP